MPPKDPNETSSARGESDASRGARAEGHTSTRTPVEAGWEREAAESEIRRADYRRVMVIHPVGPARQNVAALFELLNGICDVREKGLGLYPAVQYDLRERARRLFESATGALLPDSRANKTLPSSEEVDSLVREALWVLNPGRLSDLVQLPGRDTHAAGRELPAYRKRLIELWVRRNISLAATNKEVTAAIAGCQAVLGVQEGVEAALQLVACLLGVSAGTVKKVRSGARGSGGTTRRSSGASRVRRQRSRGR